MLGLLVPEQMGSASLQLSHLRSKVHFLEETAPLPISSGPKMRSARLPYSLPARPQDSRLAQPWCRTRCWAQPRPWMGSHHFKFPKPPPETSRNISSAPGLNPENCTSVCGSCYKDLHLFWSRALALPASGMESLSRTGGGEPEKDTSEFCLNNEANHLLSFKCHLGNKFLHEHSS